MNIDVEWIQNPSDPESVRIPIPVKFEGGIDKTSGIENIASENAVAYGLTGAVAVNGFNGMVQVYSLDGRLVNAEYVNESAEIAINRGLYIVRLGNKAVKVIVK